MYILFSLKVWLTTPWSPAFAWSSWHVKTNSKLIQFNLLLNYKTSLGTNTNLPKELSIFNRTTLSISAVFSRTTEMPASTSMIPKAIGQSPLLNLKLYHLLSLPIKKVNGHSVVSCTRCGTVWKQFFGVRIVYRKLLSVQLVNISSEVEILQKAREQETRHLCIKLKVKNMKGK